MKIALILVLVYFCLFCSWLVVESGVFEKQSPTGPPLFLLQSISDNPKDDLTNTPDKQVTKIEAASPTLLPNGDPAKIVTLGSVDPKSGFKYELELNSKGAAIRKATFSEFDDRDYKNPQPLIILSPARGTDGRESLSMAIQGFQNDSLIKQKLELPLDTFIWKSLDKVTTDDSQTVSFVAVFKPEDANDQVFKLTKKYTITRNSYLLDYEITVENLSDSEQQVQFSLAGPRGLGRESFRSDMRRIVAGFRTRDSQNPEIVSTRLEMKNLLRAKSLDDRRLVKPGTDFLWAAAVNKYFAAIVVPLPSEGEDSCDWVTDKTGHLYNPDGDSKANSGDETVGVDFRIASSNLAAMGQADSSKTYHFQLYLGPKDKSLFDKVELYRKLGFLHTIDFLACCCPAGIIKPLAFGVMAIMKWMYTFIHNYGVVIIILVLLMRLAMHPITKKSQVSMSKMTKLAPRAEEIKKKYANNKTEMNKQMMALYREQGASPIIGFLPMMVQMPIWIALWSAVYASIDLRGAPFLPFWITDLSVPDALIRFSTVTVPLLNWKIESLNLLPILMGVAFYLQQQLMPSQANASVNPQMAQQQKMMKIIFPLLFPLAVYKAPSGVNLYIMASTFAGVIEQHVIRKHIKEKEEAESKGMVAATSKTGGKVKKKKPKPFYKNM